ncbi:alpha/beta-hydrolase [Xylariaceae sp. FL0804]|nr:alpha/beta-hydrolase [Xylariaceae sp. FL0804]
MAANLEYKVHHYGEHSLQRVGVWKPADDPPTPGIWVVYIHGGALVDPTILHETLTPTIDVLLSSSTSKHPIGGFASIDYQLSPHPKFPQDPATTPPQDYRNARHPDHIDDVRSAVALLQATYKFGADYVLIGHSAGALLSFQLMDKTPPDVTPPRAMVATSGIYDFNGINERHGGGYAFFLEAAFGDQSLWDAAAPVKCPRNWRENLTRTETVTLAWSRDDELVDEPEIDGMTRRLLDDGRQCRVVKDMRGSHDECWEKGHELARLITEAMGDLGLS